MGRKRKVEGECQICGDYGRLSYEHVPPEKAFNNNRYFYRSSLNKIVDTEEILSRNIYDHRDKTGKRTYRKFQGGIGFYTLCNTCNNNTGSWYAKDFINWAYQSMDILLRAKGKPTLSYPTSFYPLRVIKQVITMFFSINPSGFNSNNPSLVKFILDKESKNLSPKYKLFCYYNISGKNRYLGNTVVGNFNNTTITQMSELTFPPFGFVLLIESENHIDSRLVEISHYSKVDYYSKVDFYQKFSVLYQ